MSHYTVVWAPDVQDEYLESWLKADSAERTRLTDAANTIDAELAVSPENRGEAIEFDPALRLWRLPGFVPDIVVVFEILSDDRLVRILRIACAAN